MNGSWIRLLRAGIGIGALAFFAATSYAQKPKEPWDYLSEPAFKSANAKALGPKSKPRNLLLEANERPSGDQP